MNRVFYKLSIFIGFIYCFKTYNLYNNIKLKSKLIKDNIKDNQCIISSKFSKSFCNDEIKIFVDMDNVYKDKKLITISPGGFKGFYILGILSFIKENYNTDDFIYSGASAGAWNSLFMCYKGSPLEFAYNFLDINVRKTKSISELQYFMKYKLLSTYKSEDFDLNRIFIGVTTFKFIYPCINIYSDFIDLEDAINCCMASSHIPLITGGITNRYKNMYSFDGGFSNNPYLNKTSHIHISYSMWNKFQYKDNNSFIKRNLFALNTNSEFFSITRNNILELYDNGYNDARINKDILDSYFDSKNIDNSLEF
jgi:hypothetical protein